MTFKINFQSVIIVALLVILYTMLLDKCSSEEKFRTLKMNYDKDVTHIKDSLGNIISVKDVEIVQNQESMKDLRARLFETTDKYNKKVEEVQALIGQKTEVIIKEVKVPYIDSVKMKKWADSINIKCADVIKYYEDSTVKIGARAVDSTGYYKVDATVEKKGIKMNEIKFVDSQYVAITKMKGGIFKRNTKGKFRLYVKPTTRVEIKHTNPYFQNTGVDAFVFEKKTNRGYGNGLLHGAVGAVAIGTLLLILTR